MRSLDIDNGTRRTRKRCAHRHRKSVRFRTREDREYRLAVALTDASAFIDIAECRRRLDGSRSRKTLARIAQPALTVLDV
ncbi:hypothetical protein [Burkholderia cenocepacia]|uniref:hypothetical protein n=1 Tax=Burkholderia cenocepacia TaxID=95486 RepID=UPI001F4B1BC0|nr:hypothetical protein [Burkholderia cenocepacia]